MKSVNRRDQALKDNIRSETLTKFDNPLMKKTSRELLPPTVPVQNGSTTPSSSMSNNFKRISPRVRGLDEPHTGKLPNSSLANTDLFKLENKVREFGKRKGSRTNRENSETFEGRFNFTRLDERRAEHKNQKTTQSIPNLPNAKNIERKAQEKEQRVNQWEERTRYSSKNEIKKEIDREKFMSNKARCQKGKEDTYNSQFEDSPKFRRKKEEFKDLSKSPQDVLACLKSPSSPARTVSIIDDTQTKKSLDFSHFLKSEVDTIFTIAGYSDKPIETIENYSCNTKFWKPIECPLKDGRTKFAVVSYIHVDEVGNTSDRILIMGGKTSDGKRTDLIQEYDPATNKLKTFAHLTRPMSGFAAVCVVNKVYVIGGNDGKIRNQVECLDLETKWWSSLPALNQRRDELAAAYGPDNCLYAIGGYGGHDYSNTKDTYHSYSKAKIEGSSEDASTDSIKVNKLKWKQQESASSNSYDNKCSVTAEKFDFSTQKWTVLGKMGDPRRALSAVSLPNGVYAIGGYDGEKYLNSVERYDQDSDEWVKVKPMNTKRWTLSSVSSNDWRYIYAIGGFNGSALETVERYDVVFDKWENIKSMNSKRFMHASVIIRL